MTARSSGYVVPRLLLAIVAVACAGSPLHALTRTFLLVPSGRRPLTVAGSQKNRGTLLASPAARLHFRVASAGGIALTSSILVVCAQAAAEAKSVSLSRLPRGQRPKGARKLLGGWSGQRMFSVRFRHFWDYTVFPRTYFMRRWQPKDIFYGIFLAIMHLGALAAPFYYTKEAFLVFLAGYVVSAMGITVSYHRQLAHRSFRTPKWLEYLLAYCGALALQGHPINWASTHRHHHGATDTENDVHSPQDGFWWSHIGWLVDKEGTSMRSNKENASDLSRQWFYRHLQRFYAVHAIVLPSFAAYAVGGLPLLLWGFFARVVWTWHVTWCVNSVSHVWGFKDWNTADNSMNNWLVGVLAFGEGWHNNHHAFETSCRHGLKWWQLDMTWYFIKLLSLMGLASDLKYPSEHKMQRMRMAEALT